MDARDIALTREWAEIYAEKDWNVLPSRPDKKAPFPPFADHWETPLPPGLFDRYPCTSLQIMTGRAWRLLVIDLDGLAAREWWEGLGKPVPRTWITHSGGDGLHIWFRLPPRYPHKLPKAILWRADPSAPRVKGEAAAERLCDGSLVMAPPSLHPRTGRRYRFLDNRHSPLSLPGPADCPRWLLDLPPVLSPIIPFVAPPKAPKSFKPSGNRYRAADVIEAIPDLVGLAQSWGLRVAGRPSAKGWVPCHAVDRADKNPSASISQTTGTYKDFTTCNMLLFFQLAAALGAYADWRDAMADLGDRFGARKTEQAG